MKAPSYIFAACVGLVASTGLWEYLGMLGKLNLMPKRRFLLASFVLWFLFVATVCAQLAHHDSYSPFSFPILGIVFLAPWTFLLAGLSLGEKDLRAALPSLTSSWFSFLYIAVPFTCLISLQAIRGGWLLLFFLFVTVWSGDIAALYVGKLIGKHKLAPQISPGKTIEGSLASFFTAILLGVAWVWLTRDYAYASLSQSLIVNHFYPRDFTIQFATRPPSLFTVVALGALINAASQIGDLFESMIKRGAGVKDSGYLLPGHGGVLDRVDALLFAAPVFYFALLFVGVPVFQSID